MANNNLGSSINSLIDNNATKDMSFNPQFIETQRQYRDKLNAEYPQYEEKLKGYGYNGFKGTKDVSSAMDNLFNEWNTKYPDNKNWHYEKSNRIWDKEFKERYDLLDKLFDKFYADEWINEFGGQPK